MSAMLYSVPVIGSEFVVSGPAEWSAVSSPVRFELVEYLRMVAPCSIAELGAAMARPADSLYHHIRVLERVGIVVRAKDRVVRGRREAVFDLSARRFRFESPGDRGAVGPARMKQVQLVKRLIASLGRMTVRSIGRALEAGVEVGEGSGKQVWARVETAWLDEASLAEVNRLLGEIDRVFERGRQVREGRLFSVGLFLGPVARSVRGETKKSAAAGGPRRAAGKGAKGGRTWVIPSA